jgi:CBS domain-containing protein
MAEHRLGSALVVRKGKLVGVFTVTDACRVLAGWLREMGAEVEGDGLIADWKLRG